MNTYHCEEVVGAFELIDFEFVLFCKYIFKESTSSPSCSRYYQWPIGIHMIRWCHQSSFQ